MGRLDTHISEREWQKVVLDAAKAYGWHRQHSRKTKITRSDGTIRHATAITGEVGFPDLVLARAGQVMFLELKTEKTNLEPDQRLWLSALTGEPLRYVMDWTSRGDIPDGRALMASGWMHLSEAGSDWFVMVAGPVRPRHRGWLLEVLR